MGLYLTLKQGLPAVHVLERIDVYAPSLKRRHDCAHTRGTRPLVLLWI